MIVPCECGAKLKIDDARIGDKGSRIRCPRCSAILHVKKKADQTVERPPAASALFQEKAVSPAPAAPPSYDRSSPPASSMPVVLIAHDSEAVREMIRALLSEAGFAVETAADGVEALKKASEIRPQAMLLDVGLPGIYGFELCERLKGDEQTSAIKIILLTSVYDVGRYKREPANLYGADDYIEKHNISDYLTLKIRKLLYPEQYRETPAQSAPSGPAVETPLAEKKGTGEFEFITENVMLRREPEAAPGPTALSDSQAEHAATAEPRSWPGDSLQPMQDSSALAPESFSLDSSIFQKQESDIPRVEAGDPEAVEKARRFARIIVSDIALYNEEAVREGIKNGTFYELLKEDIEDGRRLYEKRVPDSIKSKKDFYQETFDNFIAAQKKIVR
jgi:predicted Zn finger-like uncharacterized protein